MVSRTNKFRGSRTHGRGIKGGRGHGLRGGRGNAGLHKHKFMHMLKYDPDHFGRHGFKRPQKILEDTTTINVAEIEERLSRMLKAQQAVKKGDVYEINLTELGIDKLLGSGQVRSRMMITVSSASRKAVEKITKAGGKVILPEGVQAEAKPAEGEVVKKEKVVAVKKVVAPAKQSPAASTPAAPGGKTAEPAKSAGADATVVKKVVKKVVAPSPAPSQEKSS